MRFVAVWHLHSKIAYVYSVIFVHNVIDFHDLRMRLRLLLNMTQFLVAIIRASPNFYLTETSFIQCMDLVVVDIVVSYVCVARLFFQFKSDIVFVEFELGQSLLAPRLGQNVVAWVRQVFVLSWRWLVMCFLLSCCVFLVGCVIALFAQIATAIIKLGWSEMFWR